MLPFGACLPGHPRRPSPKWASTPVDHYVNAASNILARDEVPASSKKAGRYVGRVAVRATGSFNIQIGSTVVQGISHKHCRIIQRSDGYGYSRIATSKGDAGAGHVARAALSLPGLKPEVSRAIG